MIREGMNDILELLCSESYFRKIETKYLEWTYEDIFQQNSGHRIKIETSIFFKLKDKGEI